LRGDDKGVGEEQWEGCRGRRSPAARLRWLGYGGEVEVEKRAIGPELGLGKADVTSRS
jgi:hypothetical protein